MEKLRLKFWLIVMLLFLLCQGTISKAEPVVTAFTYQGRLVDANQPDEGYYDFQFKLFDGPTDGNQVGITVDVNNVDVIDGSFTVELDFVGNDAAEPEPQPLGLNYKRVWGDGEARWLEIGVRPALILMGGPEPDPLPLIGFTILSPRQKIMPVPFALYALSSGTSSVPGVGGSGTDNYIAKFIDPNTIGNSGIYEADGGNIGIGTINPAYPLDIAGAVNLNNGKTGVALRVNGAEALWYNGDYFSWGYGGSRNYFADPVGIGTNPAERLDLSWSGGVNARIGTYNYLGSCFSSATFVLGNNVRARTDSVNGIVVGNPHDSYGYRAITMSTDGIAFYGVTGKVAAGDPLANERMRITNDGNVGIGTTTPRSILEVKSEAGNLCGTFTTFPTSGSALSWGTQGIGLNLVRKSTGTWEAAGDGAHNAGAAIFGAIGPEGLRFVAVESTGSGNQTFTDSQIMGKVRMVIMSAGNVGIGVTSPSEKLDVNGTARLRGINVGSGTTVVADGNGKLYKQSSSSRYKTNIQDLESDTNRVLELRPVRFQWKTTGQEEIGLIAEEVEDIAKDLVIYDQEGKPDAVKYDKVALYLLSVVKEQQQRIAALEAKQAEYRSLAQRIEALEQTLRQQNFTAKEVQ